MKSWEINKKNYIDFVYGDEEVSKQIKYNLYDKNIKMYEDIKEKDLMYFNVEELIDLMQSIPTTAISVKDNVYSFITQYLDYQISKGNITMNNMMAINRREATSVHKRSSKSRYISMNNFINIINSLTSTADWQHIIPLCICRYGIKGKDSEEAIRLRMSDINRENNIVNIRDEDNNIIKCIPIDELFINWCENAEEEVDYEGECIIKTGQNSRKDSITEAVIYNRTKKACESGGYKRMSLNNLVLSRKIDLILSMRKERRLTNDDFQQINIIFNPDASNGSYNSFVRFYESLTGDKVYKATEKREVLIDPNAEKFVEQLKQELEIIE